MYCDLCDNQGSVNCYCGGDLCVCTNYGERVCPKCYGDCGGDDDDGDEFEHDGFYDQARPLPVEVSCG